MAVKQTPESDPRHPDTSADKAEGGTTPAADLDPADYGFRTIDEAEVAKGPGAVEPTKVEPVSSVPNSTFASRSKAIRSAENK
jgi:hypothetical protein